MTQWADRLLKTSVSLLILFWVAEVYANGRLVLVMDDLGNQRSSGLDAIALPWVSTVAIMPGRPFTQELAEYAHELGKEVIVHAPMSNLTDFPLGPMGLTRDHGSQSLLDNLRLAIDSVPFAVGLSNHMGSRLTQDVEAMSWIMRELRRQNLYYFDSRTISGTIAWKVADEHSVPWSMRQVFLDHYQTQEFIAGQWQLAQERVANGETVTVIAHPYPETLAFFNDLADFPQNRLSLVPLSQILHYPVTSLRRQQSTPEGT